MVDYYATSLHEHTHWTGHPSRLNRPLVGKFGSEDAADYLRQKAEDNP
jgi:antirestriction protein ArdC